MNAITYREAFAGIAAFGFIVGWLSGAFLALWAAFTLGML